MHRIGNLFDTVIAFPNLWWAAHKAWRGKKSKTRIADFYFNLERELLVLQKELVSGQYQPRPYQIFTVTDPKRREIAAADFRDRVVHHAIVNVLDPFFERRLIHDTYACRVGKGTHAAVQKAQQFSKIWPFFLKCDIRKYFQSVDHAILNTLLERITKDKRVLDLLKCIVTHPVAGHLPGKGIPIGNLTSQHFANLYETHGRSSCFCARPSKLPSWAASLCLWSVPLFQASRHTGFLGKVFPSWIRCALAWASGAPDSLRPHPCER